MKIEIRDHRTGFLWISNSFFDTYARQLHGSALLVYLCLARFANNKTQECFPSYEMLSERTGLSRSSVAEALHELRNYKLISWEKEGRHNVYCLLDTNSPKTGLVQPGDTNSPDFPQKQSTPVDSNKTYNKTQEQKPLSDPSVPTDDLSLNSEPEPPKTNGIDSRHKLFMEQIQKAHKHFVKDSDGKDVTPVLGAAAGKNLKRLLGTYPSLDVGKFRRWLTIYHQSEDHNPFDSPVKYILKLPHYEGGALNKFGRSDG